MPIIQELVDFDQVYQNLRSPPLLLNDIPTDTIHDKERIKNHLTTTFTIDVLSNIPKCYCTHTHGRSRLGEVCEECGSAVVNYLEGAIEPIVWFKTHPMVRKLINPAIWIMLVNRFILTKARFSLMNWLVDTSYNPKIPIPDIVTQLKEDGIERGYNYFVDNFDDIIELIFSIKKPKKREYLKELIGNNRDKIFSDYYPLPNRILMIIDRTYVSTQIDNQVDKLIDVVSTIGSMYYQNRKMGQSALEKRTVKAISLLTTIVDSNSKQRGMIEFYYREYFAPKKAIFRGHIYGTRCHFSFRAVITSITRPHNYDEVMIPWKIALCVLREHIMNVLFKRGYSLNNAIDLIYQSCSQINPIIEEIFDSFILATKGRGIPGIINRNPSLGLGSIQKVRMFIKKDIEDQTIGIGILIIKAPNADFDGDNCQIELALDRYIDELMEPFSPHHNILTAEKPRQFSNCMTIPATVTSLFESYINDIDNTPDPDKLYRFKELIAREEME